MPTKQSAHPDIPFDSSSPWMMTKPEVLKVTGLQSQTLDRLERSNQFPARRIISTHRRAWLSTDVRRWIETREQVVRASEAK